MAKNNRETICFKHCDFELYVSCEELDAPRKKLAHTYAQRGLAQPVDEEITVLVDGQPVLIDTGDELSRPFFFENRQYWFEVAFSDHVEPDSALVSHKYRLIEESFTVSPRSGVLQAMINFGNDVGRCVFKINYTVSSVRKSVPVEFTVLATKMVQSQDLGLMNQQIDTIYPLWRYAISSKTTQSQGQSIKQPEKFELFWLAQFERLKDEFEQGLKRILYAPHNRLQSFTVLQKLDRINRKLSAKQQEHAKELIASKRLSTRMRISHQRLNLDTPENRFIKMVLKRTKVNLSKFIQAMAKFDAKASASASFCQSLQDWQDKIGKFSKHQLWQEVGEFEGQSSESKVLQQGAGYSKVYKVWQQLKHYLNQTNGDALLSIKSVADIYEVWCFLEVKTIIEALGFVEKEHKLSRLKQVQFERQFRDDEMAAAFVYFRQSDGMTIELAHEPSFTPKGEVNRTWLANQRPDIVLRVTLSNNESFFILFDAKYRIDTKPLTQQDGVPEDAINQMHRYRDAIIHQQTMANERPLKSRPVMGAFALYPGFFDQTTQQNPYDEAIKEIGIGAFALLPSAESSNSHNQWLRSYLTNKLGVKASYPDPRSNDYYFVEDSARIAPYGGNLVRHYGLTMVAPINEIGRDASYLTQANTGKLLGYHTQLLATNRQNVHRNIVREVRYLLLTVRVNPSDPNQLGKFLYRVANVKLLPRHDIDRQLTGKLSNDNHHYWVFDFVGEPEVLTTPIVKPYSENFQFKLTKAEYLQQISHWDDVKEAYQLYTDLDLNW